SQEHWDMEVGTPDNSLMKKQFIRAAIAEGMNRQALIGALYGKVAPGLKPLNNPEYEQFAPAKGKFAYFNKYNYNPKKAIALLKKERCPRWPVDPDPQQPRRGDGRWPEDAVQLRPHDARVPPAERRDLHRSADGDRHQAQPDLPRCLQLLRHVPARRALRH